MALAKVSVIKGNGGLGRRNPTADGVVGIITTGIEIPGKLALGTPYRLRGLADLEALGVNADYDEINKVLIFGQLSELFRLNPSATVYLVVAPQATTMADLVDPTKTIAPKLLTHSGNTIVQLGVFINPVTGYAGTLKDGLDEQVLAAVLQAQLLAEYGDGIDAPLSAVILEGYHFNGTVTAAKDLRTLAANKVSVVIGQDASGKAATAYPNHAAVGAYIGLLSAASVNENIGWPEKFPLTDALRRLWLKAGISGGIALNSLSAAQLDQLDDKGYLFARIISQLPGVFFNDTHTATKVADDYARIEMNRTMDKAIKLVRGALVPKLKSPVFVDQDTGNIRTATLVDFETQAKAALDQMIQAGEISGYDVYINPAQNILAANLLEVEVTITPVGSAHTIRLKIGFNNPFKPI